MPKRPLNTDMPIYEAMGPNSATSSRKRAASLRAGVYTGRLNFLPWMTLNYV